MTYVNFDRAVDYYDETRKFSDDETERAVELIAQVGKLDASSRVLEIGIGTGRIALPLAKHVGGIYGADISIGMMGKLLEKRTSEPVYPVQADALHLPYLSNTFDAVTVVHVFHLLPELEPVIEELKRVLKSGGRLIQAWHTNDTTFRDLRASWREVLPPENTDKRWNRAKTIMDKVGWQQHDHQRISHNRPQTPRMFIDRFRDRIWSSTWPLTEEEHTNGLQAMTAYAEAHFGDLDQTIDVLHEFHAAAYEVPS